MGLPLHGFSTVKAAAPFHAHRVHFSVIYIWHGQSGQGKRMQTVRCGLRETAENKLIAVASVIEGAVYTADGGGGRTGLFRNFKISFVFS